MPYHHTLLELFDCLVHIVINIVRLRSPPDRVPVLLGQRGRHLRQGDHRCEPVVEASRLALSRHRVLRAFVVGEHIVAVRPRQQCIVHQRRTCPAEEGAPHLLAEGRDPLEQSLHRLAPALLVGLDQHAIVW
eukprot:scaffold12216_cov112-Isochrysis_galbana.AAC.3